MKLCPIDLRLHAKLVGRAYCVIKGEFVMYSMLLASTLEDPLTKLWLGVRHRLPVFAVRCALSTTVTISYRELL